jgi:hypothetical protein
MEMEGRSEWVGWKELADTSQRNKQTAEEYTPPPFLISLEVLEEFEEK